MNGNNNNNNVGPFRYVRQLENDIHYPNATGTTASATQQPVQQLPHSHYQQQSTSFGILTPDQSSWATSSAAGPGMIPLIPLAGGSIPSFGTNEPRSSSNNNNITNLPQSLPDSLTDEDLRILSSTTREAMEQRLLILETVQNQIFHSMQILTQALSVMPNINNTNTTAASASTSATDNNSNNAETNKSTSNSGASSVDDNIVQAGFPPGPLSPSTSPLISPSLPPSSSSSNNIESNTVDQGVSSAIEEQPHHDDESISSSRRRKGKMLEQQGGSSFNGYSVDSDHDDNEHGYDDE
ncbi:hypothetical protein BDA99DRAFT_514402 [Phascolomyces articulosus]|uniref:Uncharacterized protein n=1 Tax=Phascolomyces articulosus TaxID=60185 RepID=A0AAD5K7D7_9FUNG|nr:hypothetical protein BDA99DRAFT_514402 [Phascolomyces articulosus]